jgi:hypothetical protein
VTVEDRTSKRVAVRVAFSLVRGRPQRVCRSAQQQVGTLTTVAEPRDEHLESVLGATPHEFESRKMILADPAHEEHHAILV